MGTIAVDEFPDHSWGSTIQNSGVGVDDANNIGKSTPVSYTAPPQEQANPIERLAKGFTKTLAEAPQMLGQGLYYLGSNMDPGASKTEQEVGGTFGDRMARMGLVMTERNQDYIKENFPEQDDIWSRVGGAVPMVGGLALGALLGFPGAAALTTAGVGGLQATVSSFSALRDRGASTARADAMSALIGAGTGSAMAFGIGNFMKATGGVIPQIAKGVINGFSGGALQSTVSGSLQLATGTTEFKGVDSLKEVMADAVHTGVTFAILGGPLGLHLANVQHNGVKQGFKEMGLGDQEAGKAATIAMAKGMHEGLKHVETIVKATPDELGRINFHPTIKPKPIDDTGAPSIDVLDEPYVPKEPSKVEALTAELEAKKKSFALIKKDIKDLQGVLDSNKNEQLLTGEPLRQFNEAKTNTENEFKTGTKNLKSDLENKQYQIESKFNRESQKLIQKSAALEFKLSEVQTDQAKTQRYLDQRILELKNEGLITHPDLDKLAKMSLALSNKEDVLHEKISEVDNEQEQLKLDKEHSLADHSREKEVKTKMLEADKEEALINASKNIPLLHEAEVHLTNLKQEAETLGDQIDNLKEKLKPKTNPVEELNTQITKIKQGFRHGRSLTEGEIGFVQKEFNKLIDQSDLDLSDKAKFRALLPKIQSQEDFFKALPEVSHKIHLLEQRAEQREWLKAIKDLDLSKLPVEYQDALKPILESFDFNKPSKAEIIKRGKTLDFFKHKLAEMEPGAVAANGEPLLSSGEQRALDDAARLSVTEMLAQSDGHERLRAIHDMIMSVAHEGKMKNKYFSNLKERNHEKWVEGFLKNLTDPTNTERLDNLEKALKQKNQSPWQWLWGQKNALQQEQMTPELVMDVLGLNDEHQVMHDAYQRKLENQKVALGDLKDLHGKTDVHEALAKKFDLEVPVGKATKIYKGVTGNELLKIYAQSFDEGGMRHLEHTFENKATLDGLLRKTEELYPKQTKAVFNQFEYYRTEGYDRLNEVVRAMQGHNMAKVDFYDPIGGSLEDRSGRDLQQEMQLGVKGMMGRAVPESGFIKTRVKSKLAFDKFDYYGDLVRNAMDRENYISMAQALRDMNKKLYDPRITTAIKDRFGPNMVRIVHKWLKDAAFDGHQNDSASAKVLAFIRATFIGAKIGFNPVSAGKVFSQLSPAADYVGRNWVMSGTKDYILHRGQLDKFIDDKSLMMKNRYLRQERDFQNLIETKGNSALGGENARTQIIKLSMVMHQEADKIVTRATWIGAYNKVKAQEFLGGNEADAIAAADSAVRYTHPMGGSLYLPDIFRGNEFQKAMTTFHGATNRNFNLLLKNNQNFENTPSGYLKYAKTIFSVGILPAIFLSALSLHRAPSKREVALETLNQTTGSDIWLGVATNALMTGEKPTSTVPWLAPFTDALTVLTAEKPATKVRYGLAAVDDITGLSTANLFRMMTGQMFEPRGHEGFMHGMDSEDGGSEDGQAFRSGGV